MAPRTSIERKDHNTATSIEPTAHVVGAPCRIHALREAGRNAERRYACCLDETTKDIAGHVCRVSGERNPHHAQHNRAARARRTGSRRCKPSSLSEQTASTTPRRAVSRGSCVRHLSASRVSLTRAARLSCDAWLRSSSSWPASYWPLRILSLSNRRAQAAVTNHSTARARVQTEPVVATPTAFADIRRITCFLALRGARRVGTVGALPAPRMIRIANEICVIHEHERRHSMLLDICAAAAARLA